MIILSSKKFINIITRNFASAITLFPFIILNGKHLKDDKILINHEKIHIRQQIELIIIFFYIQYVSEYLFYRFIKGLPHYESYRSISFEQEAYDNEDNLSYLSNRKIWAWWYILD